MGQKNTSHSEHINNPTDVDILLQKANIKDSVEEADFLVMVAGKRNKETESLNIHGCQMLTGVRLQDAVALLETLTEVRQNIFDMIFEKVVADRTEPLEHALSLFKMTDIASKTNTHDLMGVKIEQMTEALGSNEDED